MEYNLKGKMGTWGPFEQEESKWHIFTIGNPNEGHGLALPRNIDDLHAKKAARDLEMTSGQRHVAHVPYTTDRCGSVAKDWSPNWLPWEEFFHKTKEFLKWHVDILRQQDHEVSRVMLIIGHGGNAQLKNKDHQKEIQELLELDAFISISATLSAQHGLRLLNRLEELASVTLKHFGVRFGHANPEDLAFLYTQMLLSAGHASHMEHSLAAAMEVCDLKKLQLMNDLLSKDFDEALKRWPPIGGLGGYLMAGGKYTRALGTETKDKYGLWNCLNGLKTLHEGKILVAPELGKLIHSESLKEKIELMKKTP